MKMSETEEPVTYSKDYLDLVLEQLSKRRRLVLQMCDSLREELRYDHLCRLAYAQWNLEEFKSGEAIRFMLENKIS